MESPQPLTKNFISPKEAAIYLGVHINTVYKWMNEPKRKLPVRRISSNRYFIPREKFIKWANAGTGD